MWHYHSESRRSEQLQGKSLFGSPVGHFEVDFSDFEMLCFICILWLFCLLQVKITQIELKLSNILILVSHIEYTYS